MPSRGKISYCLAVSGMVKGVELVAVGARLRDRRGKDDELGLSTEIHEKSVGKENGLEGNVKQLGPEWGVSRRTHEKKKL